MKTSAKISLLDSIINLDVNPSRSDILQCLLPQKPKGGSHYSFHIIAERLRLARDTIHLLDHQNNTTFDEVLDKAAIEQLDKLYKNLNKTQLDVMKLQCEIAYTKEQYDHVNKVCDNPTIMERRKLIEEERNIRGQLQQLKFEPLKLFFNGFIEHLYSTIASYQKLCSQTPNYQQVFDWDQFCKTISLLKACGKTLLDVAKFERLYQSNSKDASFVEMVFKLPIESIDYNDFVESSDTYSIESQLQISLQPNQPQDLNELLSNSSLFPPIQTNEQLSYTLFEQAYTKLEQATRECCELLVKQNIGYIEAHLADGINVDKLNAIEDMSQARPGDNTLPDYALSPQEYITQIGQHLLTLRKQTEQFESDKYGALRFGLEYLKGMQDMKSSKMITEIVMRCIARHCIALLLVKTNKSILSKLTLKGKRQLATDALYLDNVLEDLNLLDDEPNVEQFKRLLIQ